MLVKSAASAQKVAEAQVQFFIVLDQLHDKHFLAYLKIAFLTFKHELPILNHLPRAMSHNILTFTVLSNSDKNTLANITDKSCENYSPYQTT